MNWNTDANSVGCWRGMAPGSFRRALAALGAVVAAVIGSLGLCASASAQAPEPVPCTSVGDGHYECGWWRAGDGRSGGAIVVRGGAIVGYLHRGRNWIVCQQKGAEVHSSAGNRNHWYAWTLADNGLEWGWVSALDAQGGADFGDFGGGVPDCGQSHAGPAVSGGPPAVAGLWEGSPPAGSESPTPQGMRAPPTPAAPPPGSDRVDHTIYRPGQHLVLRTPSLEHRCTAAFVVLFRGTPYGLTAGHCADEGDRNPVTREGIAPRASARSRGTSTAPRASTHCSSGRPAASPGGARTSSAAPTDRSRRSSAMPNNVTYGSISASALPGENRVWAPKPVRPDHHAARHRQHLRRHRRAGWRQWRPGIHAGAGRRRQPRRRHRLTRGLQSRSEKWECFVPLEPLLNAAGVAFPVETSGGPRKATLLQAVTVRRSGSRRSGARLNVRLAQAAAVTVRVRRSGTARWQTVRVRGHRGVNRLRIKRFGGRRFPRGRYEASVSARPRRRATPWKVSFRIR